MFNKNNNLKNVSWNFFSRQISLGIIHLRDNMRAEKVEKEEQVI